GGRASRTDPRTGRRGLARTGARGQGALEIGWALSMRGGQRFEMSRHRLSELPCGRWPTVRTPAIDEGQEQEKDALRVTQATLEGFELARSELELRLVEQALRLAEIVPNLAAHVGELVIRPRLRALAATQACEPGQGSEHVGEPLLPPGACRYRPEDAPPGGEGDEAQR